MAASIIKVPGSLGQYAETSSPLRLQLFIMPTYNIDEWRGLNTNDTIAKSEVCYEVPLPERGLGASTELNFQDEEKGSLETANAGGGGAFAAAMSKRYTSVLGDAADKIDPFNSGLLREFILGAQKGLGGSTVPLDLSALTVYGTKKRSYAFNFELFSYLNSDGKDIANFMRKMHGYSTIVSRQHDATLRAPAVFNFRIVTRNGINVTKNWYPDPLPCAMINFQHTPTDFIQTFDARTSARMIFTVQLAEIEPVSYNPETDAFSTIWEGKGPIPPR